MQLHLAEKMFVNLTKMQRPSKRTDAEIEEDLDIAAERKLEPPLRPNNRIT
jgi:hypothetical protein